MLKIHRPYAISLTCAALAGAGALALLSQTPGRESRALIRERVDANKLVTLRGNTRPEATAANDLGEASDGLPMEHMLLQLRRSPQQERAVEQFIDSLHDPASPNFHKWLSAAEFGKNFGAAESDIQTITGWLESYGFAVNVIYPSGMAIDFSGNAGEVRRAFHTSIHNLDVAGAHHIGNFGDPQIPEALAPAVAGIVSLHDFRPRKMIAPQYTFNSGGQIQQALVPADLATIYDFTPLFSQGGTGAGQTIVVLEDSDLFSRTDWTNFRSAFGLSQYTTASLIAQHPPAPSGINNCFLPGVNPDGVEAALDVEWASAAAPGATIVAAACGGTATPGTIIAMQNLVNGNKPPAIVSISYGFCEAGDGAAVNASINSLYQQAVAEGTSIFVAAGDEAAASCDFGANATTAIHGIAVSGWASTPYNVAVGGTDFADTVNGTASMYWSQTNSPTYGSALSYIPEIPWNDSCAGALVANYHGYSTGYGPNGFCNSSTAMALGFVNIVAGSGGPSNCATGAPSIPLVSSGSCRGYGKPSWQKGVAGIPDDGVRGLPDVSMFAANGFWGHFAVFCYSDPFNGGTPCAGPPENWAGAGGTSLSAPIMAGVQALVNQKAGGPQGNPNPVYYAMAVSHPNAFHPITQGDIDVNCGGPRNCYGFVGTLDYGRNGRIFGTTWAGALSVSNTSFEPAYPAASGTAWNFATGLGSVDAANLVANWGK